MEVRGVYSVKEYTLWVQFLIGSGYFAVDGNLPSETILP